MRHFLDEHPVALFLVSSAFLILVTALVAVLLGGQ